MKITNYGLWFKDHGSNDFAGKTGRDQHIYLDGTHVGEVSNNICYVSIPILVSLNAPGELKGHYWVFPRGYIPTESDFD